MPHYITRPVVLIIDDDPLTRRFLRALLERDGYDVYEAMSGRIGLRLVAAVEPTVVVLDVMMPGMDGVEACGLIVGENPALPVVILTARDDPELEASCFRAGAAGFVTKPLRPGQLSAVVSAFQAV